MVHKAIAFLWLILIAATGCTEQAFVDIPTRIEPRQPMPVGLKAIAVLAIPEAMPMSAAPDGPAGADADHSAEAVGEWKQQLSRLGFAGPIQPASERRVHDYSQAMVAKTTRLLLMEIARQGLSVQVVDRSELCVKLHLQEKDLAAAGITDPQNAEKIGHLADVQILIFCQAFAETQIDVSPDEYVDPVASALNRSLVTKTGRKIRREISGSVMAKAIYVGSSETLDMQGGMFDPIREEKRAHFDKPSRTEADLTPVDTVLAQKIDSECSKMVGAFIGCDAPPGRICVTSSEQESSRLAVGYLRARDWNRALQAFEQAVQLQPTDHRSHNGAGIAAEQLNRHSAAAAHFADALACSGLTRAEQSLYAAALGRVRMKTAASQPAPSIAARIGR